MRGRQELLSVLTLLLTVSHCQDSFEDDDDADVTKPKVSCTAQATVRH